MRICDYFFLAVASPEKRRVRGGVGLLGRCSGPLGRFAEDPSKTQQIN
jgi:hypothetical protein